MRTKLFAGFYFLIMNAFVANAQSVYHIQYNFHSTEDQTAYHAFLLKFDDGNGLLRIRFISPVTNQDAVVETDLEEATVPDNAGMPDSNALILKPANPRIIIGDDRLKFTSPNFLFNYNGGTGFLEPIGVNTSGTSMEMTSATSFTARLVERADLTKAFVSQFFSEDEDLYANLFTITTRGLTKTEKKTKLYLLAVADTADKSIGASCRKDLLRMIETFKGLADFLGIQYIPRTIWGKEYSKPNVDKAVKLLKPTENDIVVFYYTGHGFRIPERLRRFPNIKLKNFPTVRSNFRDSLSWARKSRKDNIDSSLNIEDIFTSIKGKKSKFNLVISDCCNDDIFSVNAKGSKPSKTKGSGVEWNEDNIKALFFNPTRMSVLVTAAQSGQLAASNDNFGSFFSYYFKSSMESHCSRLKKNVTWDLVLQEAKKQTISKANHTYCSKPYIPQNLCKQEPDYKIVLGR